MNVVLTGLLSLCAANRFKNYIAMTPLPGLCPVSLAQTSLPSHVTKTPLRHGYGTRLPVGQVSRSCVTKSVRFTITRSRTIFQKETALASYHGRDTDHTSTIRPPYLHHTSTIPPPYLHHTSTIPPPYFCGEEFEKPRRKDGKCSAYTTTPFTPTKPVRHHRGGGAGGVCSAARHVKYLAQPVV